MSIATPQFFGLEPVKSLFRILGFEALCPALGQFDRQVLLVSTAALRHAELTRDVTSIRNAHGWFTAFTDVKDLSRQKPTARSLNNQTRLMEIARAEDTATEDAPVDERRQKSHKRLSCDRALAAPRVWTMKENRSAYRKTVASFMVRGTRLSLLVSAIPVFTLGLAMGNNACAAPDNSMARITSTAAVTQTDANGAMRPHPSVKRRPPHYVGTVYCYACHQELSIEFARTKMGKLFLINPQNDLERKGCEGCHGPASDHAESGGGLGVGGMAEFRLDHGQTIERNNRACLECHDEAFWHGKTHPMRRMACFDCHVVMVQMSPTFQLAPAAAGEDWNRGRTWGDAALIGLFGGVGFGGWRRIRFYRRRRKG